MTEPITLPATFSETMQKNIQTIELDYSLTGTVTEEQLDWMLNNVRHLETLSRASATFVNSTDLYVAALKADISALEQENTRMENDNLALLNEIAEHLTEIEKLTQNG